MAAWDHTAALAAMIHNSHCKAGDAKPPKYFHPLLGSHGAGDTRLTKENLHVCKEAFRTT